MPRHPLVGYGGSFIAPNRRKVFYSGTGALVKGQAVFYNRDYGTAATAEPGRDWFVEDASDGNYHRFAGVTAEAHTANASGQQIEIFTPPGVMMVYTNQSCTVDTTLLAINSSGVFDAVGKGFLCARALQTVDRSSTNGTVLAYVESPFEIRPWWGTAADLRTPSPAIWQTCPWRALREGELDGLTYSSDFDGNIALANNQTIALLDQGVIGCTAATAGTTITQITTKPYGVVHLESTTDNEDAIISVLGSKNVAGQLVFESGKQLWMEACISVLNITDSKANAFCGFAEEGLVATTTLITASDAMADKDYVGFQRLFADGDKLDTVHNTAGGGGATTVKADAVTIAADTMIKVGMYCDGTTVYFYSAGTVLADSVLLAATNFPDGEEMAFYFGIMLGHGDTFSAEIDWLRIAQLRN